VIAQPALGLERAATIAPASRIPMYPLRFEPIYQHRLWGGRRLAEVLRAPLLSQGPVGEAWVLSDRDDHASRVSDGPLTGRTLGQLMEQFPEALLGTLAGRFARFPLLLKFLDAQEMLSVQVHPSDAYPGLLPAGETGKTEAWVVPVSPVTPLLDAAMPARERLFHCKEFSLWRVRTQDPFTVGAAGVPRVLVCLDGAGHVEHGGAVSAAWRGDVLLLPAALGACVFRPTGAVTLLEIELPESATSAGPPEGQPR